MTQNDRTLIIVTSITASAMLVTYGVVAAVCVAAIALYVREHVLRTATTSLLRTYALQLEDEAARNKRIEDLLESRFLMSGFMEMLEKRSVH